jgi:hypothetical protein
LANGTAKGRGRLTSAAAAAWNDSHPDDPYSPDTGGLMSAEQMESLFGDAPAPPPPPPGGAGDDSGEVPPRRPKAGTRSRSRSTGGFGGLFSRDAGKPKGKKPPRVSTESLLGSIWRGAAKLAAPLPPLQRTLRVQAPVAGLLLEDAVKDTVADRVLQPFARAAEAGKTLNALLGPPFFVTAMTLHTVQSAQQNREPSPLVMGIAVEGLRSSLMTWMDVAGPKFEQALAREREWEDKYGAQVDDFIAWLMSPPPSTAAEAEQEEQMFRRAAGLEDARVTVTM